MKRDRKTYCSFSVPILYVSFLPGTAMLMGKSSKSQNVIFCYGMRGLPVL